MSSAAPGPDPTRQILMPPGPRVVTAGDLRKKAHVKLAERVDPLRSRHKPLSLLRAEGRRVLEAFCDQDAVTLGRSDRDRLIDDVLAEAPGFGPLEELFRDDAVKEILILAAQQVLGRKGDSWLPTSSRFRDADQLRAVLARWADAGDSLVPGVPASAGFDVRLPNGFRVMAILPPAVMDVSPQAFLTRGMPVHPPAPGGLSGGSGPISAFAPRRPYPPAGGSGPLATPAPAPIPPASGPVAPTTARPSPPPAAPDPYAKIRQRVAERIVMKFASAGVYDMNLIPLPELRRIVVAHVAEYCTQERLGFDDAAHDWLALEILAGMNR